MGSVLLGAMAGGMAAVIVLFLGAGFWSAFMTYAVTGFATMCGVVVASIIRPERQAIAQPAGVDMTDAGFGADQGAPAEKGPRENAMSQWMNDPETQVADDDGSKVA